MEYEEVAKDNSEEPIRKPQKWMPCPRCMGGKMYLEENGEQVCLMCGYIVSTENFVEIPLSVHQ